MSDVQIVICGLGGQGAIFLTRLLAEAAMLEGRPVLTAETHGMAQRGGAVQSHVKIGAFEGSTVRRGRADAALVLDETRIEPARAFLRPEGSCFANAAAAPEGVRSCDAAGEAARRGVPRGGNLVLLGFAAGEEPALFPARDALLRALDRLSPDGLREQNRMAFEAGEALA
jgi:indolepyruvate ferredoxin oxidoreductase beta subunit